MIKLSSKCFLVPLEWCSEINDTHFFLIYDNSGMRAEEDHS